MIICLADDSGLEIDFLNKKSWNFFSARWGGSKMADFNIAINKSIIDELKKKR